MHITYRICTESSLERCYKALVTCGSMFVLCKVQENFTKAHPDFIDFSRVINSGRRYSIDRVRKEAQRAAELHRK